LFLKVVLVATIKVIRPVIWLCKIDVNWKVDIPKKNLILIETITYLMDLYQLIRVLISQFLRHFGIF